MNRHLLSFCIGCAAAGLLVFFIMHYQSRASARASAASEVIGVRDAVEKRLKETCRDLTARLAAFSREVASDQLFSLRLIAENNPSAPEVAGKAGQFMGPMGLSLLEIVDSTAVILSSGHFPASRGDRIPEKSARLSGGGPKMVDDNAAGRKTLTLQAKVPFTVADGIVFYAMGGFLVDDAFLEELSPLPDVKVLLRRGDTVTGTPGVRTISAVRDNKVYINDKQYAAFRILPDFAGEGDVPELIVVLMK
jgi:hypothetical protein